MSTYYNFYIGKKREGKIYPLGPFDSSGKLHSVFWGSGSFVSDLHHYFRPINEVLMTDELRKEFEYTDWNGDKRCEVYYLDFEDLPDTNFIKSGYYLMEDVMEYEKTGNADDLFYEHMSPAIYAAASNNEKIFGPPKEKYDEEGGAYEVHSASEYMYFAYPDYGSQEYESFLLHKAAESLQEETNDLVVLLMID